MQGLSKQQTLDSLRTRIETIEKRPALAEGVAKDERADSVFNAPPKALHEVFTDTPRNAGAVLGFAMGLARGLLSAERPVILYLQMLRDTHETGLPYGPGMAAFGFDPDSIILIRTETIMELLWAAEEALACRSVAAVIADVGSDPKALDFTASRRLGMRAVEARTAFLLLRYGLGRTGSAAKMRWHLAPALSSEMPFDPKAPGASRWRLTLEKGLWRGKQNEEWLLGWTQNGFDILDIPKVDAAGRPAAASPVPGPYPAALGDRLSQTA